MAPLVRTSAIDLDTKLPSVGRFNSSLGFLEFKAACLQYQSAIIEQFARFSFLIFGQPLIVQIMDAAREPCIPEPYQKCIEAAIFHQVVKIIHELHSMNQEQLPEQLPETQPAQRARSPPD